RGWARRSTGCAASRPRDETSTEESMTTRRRVIGALAGGACLVAAGARVQAQAQGKPLRLGYSMAKTGFLAMATPSQQNTYQLWLEQVNARGGMDVAGTKRPVEFVVYDDQSRPEQAVRIYEKLITDDKVDLLLAPW